MEKNSVKDGDKLNSIQKNFISLTSDIKIYNKLMNLGAKIKINDSKTYSVQVNRTIPELAKQIRKNGSVYKQLFELFVKLFYKAKKRGFIISKEFQDRVNSIIEKI